jgi:hypothetical protein
MKSIADLSVPAPPVLFTKTVLHVQMYRVPFTTREIGVVNRLCRFPMSTVEAINSELFCGATVEDVTSVAVFGSEPNGA